MTASATTAPATTIQIVPFGRRSISTTATVNPAAMSTAAARIVPVRDRFPITDVASREQARELGRDSRDVGRLRRRQRDDPRRDVLRPRPPGHLLGAEERDAAAAQRRGEVADTRVVADVGGRVAQKDRKSVV